MVNTEIRLIIFFAAKDGKALCRQQKQDQELTVAQTMNSLLQNSDLNLIKCTNSMNSSGESGHPCLIPDFRGNAFNFSPLRTIFAVGLSYMAFITLRYVPSLPAFWRVFYHNWMVNFVKDFLCIY